MSERKDLPSVTTGDFFLQRVRESLQTYFGKNNPLDRGLTVRDLSPALQAILGGSIGGGGLGGGGGAPYEPDLTPPPNATGLIVTAGLTNLIIECDDPTYTEGHGHARTIVYGATYTAPGPLPTFSDAVEITQFQGAVFAYATNPNTEWHIWIKWLSTDGVLSASPTGGTNGVSSTTGKVGTSDLNNLIVVASKLAAGAVDALDKFGSGLEPVYNVSALPSVAGYTGPKTVYLSTDGKLYRYIGGAWVATIATSDLTGLVTDAQIAALGAAKLTGQITGTQITNGSVSTPKLAAGAVTTNELAVNAVTANELAANAVTAIKIAVDAVTANKIQAGAVVAGKLAAAAIVAGDGVIQNAAITNALIANLAVDTAKIAALAVSNAKIADLNVNKLTAGNLAVGQFIRSSSYVGGSSGWSINADGSAEMNNLILRGAIFATSGTIGGISINSVAVFSSNYVAGVSGFAIFYDGSYAFNSGGTFRGTLDVKSASSGQRTEYTNVGVRVYDAGGVCRVKLGDLS